MTTYIAGIHPERVEDHSPHQEDALRRLRDADAARQATQATLATAQARADLARADYEAARRHALLQGLSDVGLGQVGLGPRAPLLTLHPDQLRGKPK